MICRNDVYLVGKIGTDYQIKKSERSNEYATFSVVIEPVQSRIDHGSESVTYIRIMAFEKRHVEYLRSVGAKPGQGVTIVGYISSHRNEIKGVPIIQNTVVVRDLGVLRTKKDKEEEV